MKEIAQKANLDNDEVQGTSNSIAYKFCQDLSDTGHLDKIFDYICRHKDWNGYCDADDIDITLYEHIGLGLLFAYDYSNDSWGVQKSGIIQLSKY